jgi:hypothetical protein
MNTKKPTDTKQVTEDLIKKHEQELKELREDLNYVVRLNSESETVASLVETVKIKVETIERLRKFQKTMGWSVTDGTPKTLRQAIEYGMRAGDEADCQIIEMHVRDFLAQKFGVALLSVYGGYAENAISILYEEITGRKIK